MRKTWSVLAILTTLIVWAIPALSAAATYWSIQRSASPSTATVYVLPAAGYPNPAYTQVGNYFNVTVTGSGTTDFFFDVTHPGGLPVSYVKVDGQIAAAVAPNVYRVSKGSFTSHKIQVVYASSFSITTSKTGYGYISPSIIGIPATGTEDRTIQIVPNSGYALSSVTIDGHPLGEAELSAVITANAYTFTDIASSHTISATFDLTQRTTAVIGSLPDTIAFNTEWLLDGGKSSGSVPIVGYAWSVKEIVDEMEVATPNATVTPTAVPGQAIFLASSAGVFKVYLVLSPSTGAESTASVTFTVLGLTAVNSKYCLDCHGVRDPAVAQAFQASLHYAQTEIDASCRSCHDPDRDLAHPFGLEARAASCASCHDPEIYPAFAASPHANNGLQVLACASCHNDHTFVPAPDSCYGCHAAMGTTPHVTSDQASRCAYCHNPHSTAVTGEGLPSHYNGEFNGAAASYVTQNAACSDCHAGGDFSANRQILTDFAGSGHGNTSSSAWITTSENDWPLKQECKRCHSTTGFVDIVSEPPTTTGVAAGQPGQILACNGCHDNLAEGSVRIVRAFTASFTNSHYSPQYAFPDERESNLCIHCHSGRNGGSSIKDSAGDFSNMPFIGPHSLAAAGTLFKTGYHFASDSSYASFSGHTGLNGNRGPCVVCHLGDGLNNHTFSVFAKGEGGAIAGIVSNTCSYCHPRPGETFTPAALTAKAAGLAAALTALEAKLAEKGIYYRQGGFFTAEGSANTSFTNWSAVHANGKHAMGAAFNFALLRQEPGAYAHNQLYARRLIFDSIDFLDNGVLNGRIDLTGSAEAAAYLNPLSADIGQLERPAR